MCARDTQTKNALWHFPGKPLGKTGCDSVAIATQPHSNDTQYGRVRVRIRTREFLGSSWHTKGYIQETK